MTPQPEAKYAQLILPLGVEGYFTYSVPEAFRDRIAPGMRVEVEFGKRKHYAAIVASLSDSSEWELPKPILALLDEVPTIGSAQLDFWNWICEYYLCGPGEVMLAALPPAFRLGSETHLYLHAPPEAGSEDIADDEYLILEALELRDEISIREVQNILQKQSVLPLVYRMIEKRWILSYEKLEGREVAAKVAWIRLHPELQLDEEKLHAAIDRIQRSERQSRLLVTYLQNCPANKWIKRIELQRLAGTGSDVTSTLLEKGLFEEMVLDKFDYPGKGEPVQEVQLSETQQEVLRQIEGVWVENKPVLLHGVTGSGKTMIYIRLMQEMLAQGKQVVYLVPEIALTTQLVHRLKTFLGDQLLEYHSELTPRAKMAVWAAARRGAYAFIGARSTIFLPFVNPALIIVDEEHDPSYKQNDPSPRYQGRDCAIVLGRMFNARVLLGSATPSLESYFNAKSGKYHYLELNARYGESELPDIQTVSLQEAVQTGEKIGNFSKQMIDSLRAQLESGKQAIIFRNRRGYSPLLQCSNCQWEACCSQCDIRLTVHKVQNRLKCHICGVQKSVPERCPNCGQYTLRQLGFGTEQIEEELQALFPGRKVQRLDLDVARSRKMQQKLIESFQDRETDILVGTQMVTKGLDFDHVGMVGVLQADQILYYPDFRSQERAFQLFTQVAGRAGRRKDKGLVLIQGYAIGHPVIQFVIRHDPESFYQAELAERKTFSYPPFVRLIRIRLMHPKAALAEMAAEDLAGSLKQISDVCVLGPSEPQLNRIKGSYVRELLLKIEKTSHQLVRIKSALTIACQQLRNTKAYRSVRVHIDVDP
jgi:primosomal protein N' (replication factor Y)